MSKSNFKKQKNILRDYIIDEYTKEYSKQTIIGLFRSIVEPVVEAASQESLVLLRLFDTDGLSSVIKRLEFSSAKVYSFCEELKTDIIANVEQDGIWDSVEFVMVLAPRYSAVLIWDHSLSASKDFSKICLIYNSRSVADVARVIFDNSKVNLEEYLTSYSPDRRENELLNVSINKLVGCLDSVNEEIVLTQAEKQDLSKTHELLNEYEYTADKAKMIAHEIKNHLSVIDLYTKITEKRLNDVKAEKKIQESLENAIKSIRYSTYSITQFIGELKTFAKPILVERKIIPMIEDVINLTSPKAKEHKVTIKFSPKKDIRVHVDEIKFHSVLINLIYNAVESIKEGGEISIEAEQEKNFARIVVKDNGEGIKPELQDKIFEEGFTTKLTGNGLGLHICKSLMREQYGEINLLKSDKDGTQMEVLVPII